MTQKKYNALNDEERELVDEIGMDEIDDNAEFIRCSHCGRLMIAETEKHYTHLGCLCDECYGDFVRLKKGQKTMTREAQIRQTATEWLRYNHPTCTQDMLVEAFRCGAEWADKHQPSPWITDRMPEIKGLISNAVVLLIDGMFYRISHLERRKDGTEFWWGVHPEDGEEVDAWMPIPEAPKGDKK